MFKVYKEMVEFVNLRGNNEAVYRNFDSYMKRLNPVKRHLLGQSARKGESRSSSQSFLILFLNSL